MVYWEDRYFECMQRALSRVRRGIGLKPHVEWYPFSARGMGNFSRLVKEDWPKSRMHGLAKSGGPIDHLICIVDADRVCEDFGVPRPPAPPASTVGWVEQADELFTDELRASATLDADRVHGMVFRWNQESLAIAAYDVESALSKGRTTGAADLAAYLGKCSPDPRTINDADFANVFRNPTPCTNGLFKAIGANAKKGGVAMRDLIDEFSKSAVDRLALRVPDLARIARKIDDLAALDA